MTKKTCFVLLCVFLTGCNYDPYDPEAKGYTTAAYANHNRSKAPPKFVAEPEVGLAFDCVTLGCSQTQTLRIFNRGGGSFYLEKIELRGKSSKDFSFVFGDKFHKEEPFYLSSIGELHVGVLYKPTDGVNDSAEIVITGMAETFDKSEKKTFEKRIPIRTRVVGKKSVNVLNNEANFHYVAVGQRSVQNVTIQNTSTGNAVISVRPYFKDTEQNSRFQTVTDKTFHLNPKEKVKLPVYFEPSREGFFEGELELLIEGVKESAVKIKCIGTSLEKSEIAVLGKSNKEVHFGILDGSQEEIRTIVVRNNGREPEILKVSLTDTAEGVFELLGILDGEKFNLDSLETVEIKVRSKPGMNEASTGELKLESESREFEQAIKLFSKTVRPLLEVNTTQLDFGKLAKGWKKTVEVWLSNVGNGPLYIEDVFVKSESSRLVNIIESPQFPLVLFPEDDRIKLVVELDAQYEESVQGALVVESNDFNQRQLKVPFEGQVTNCETLCGVKHGRASCSSGECQVLDCEKGWYDTDKLTRNGCECRQDFAVGEIGDNCATGYKVGMIGDECTPYERLKVVRGTLHSEEDVDLFFARMNDDGNMFCHLFGDGFKASVSLTKAPPGLVLCTNFQAFGSGCGGYRGGFDPNICGQMTYEKKGVHGRPDSKDVTAWVTWHPDAEPVCGEYELVFRAQ